MNEKVFNFIHWIISTEFSLIGVAIWHLLFQASLRLGDNHRIIIIYLITVVKRS